MKRYQRMVGWLTLAMLCFVIFSPAPVVAGEAERTAALFINVGKADSAVFFVGGKTYLVDTGTKGSAEAMLRALETYEVTHLDGVMITHTDKDHVGGLKALLKSDITVAHLYAPKLHSEKSDEEHPVYEASQKNNIPMTWLSAGVTIPVDENAGFTVLGPLNRDLENENNNSLVMNLQTQHGNMLLTGDMEYPEEAELLDVGVIPTATVLKVAHHGEDDSSSKRFLSVVKPKWAIISTSTEEESDTPDPKVIRILWDVKASVAVTQDATCGIYVSLSEGNVSVEKIDYRQ